MQQQKIDIDLDLQSYFNQVVASNLTIAFFAAKQAHPEKSEGQLIKMTMKYWGIVYENLENIPKKIKSQKKE